ncbi:hypothetical protein [Desulfobacula phenolica]|uniref:Uncharacterized protein n=1 Tax=Desulfobacula phenolica TaxID=90732 RepID=A0A1H2IYG6_9BACT|nr:hypothetical protein [Desulfobacula phenolica]SDU49257.1 hypothetical protein SAMN04487931_11017 [Desulfobacula phenolica]
MKKFKFIVLILFLGLILCSTLQAKSTIVANFITASPEAAQSAHLFHMEQFEQYRNDLNQVEQNFSAEFNNQFANLFVSCIKDAAKASGAGL